MRFKARRDLKDRFFWLDSVLWELEVDHGILISVCAQTGA